MSWLEPSLSMAVAAAVWIPLRQTVFKGIPGGDSGELVAEACSLGVAHPPGYPLFIYFARAAMSLLSPFGSPAFCVNVACAGLGVGTAIANFHTSCQLMRATHASLGWRDELPWWSYVTAASVSVMMALSPVFWLYSVGAEVFALNNFVVAILLYSVTKYADCVVALQMLDAKKPFGEILVQRCRHWCLWLAFWSGVSLTNQHTALFFIAPIALWTAWTQLNIFNLRWWTLYVAAATVGLLPYVHLPIAHTFWRNQGSWGDTSSLSGFVTHFLRRDYGTFQLLSRTEKHVEGFWERTMAFCSDYAFVQLPTPMLAAFIALFVCVSTPVMTKHFASRNAANTSQHPLLGLMLSMFVVYLAGFHGLSNMPLSDKLLFGVHIRFWMLPYMALYVMLAAGLDMAVSRVVLLLRPLIGGSLHIVMLPCLAGLAGLAVATQLSRNFDLNNHSNSTVVEQYGRALLESVPPHAILIVGYDMQWTSTRYLQACEHFRTDVNLFNGPVMSFSWFAAQRTLYPDVAFPGTHLTMHMSPVHAKGGFSLADFYAANLAADCGNSLVRSYDAAPPHPDFRPRQTANILHCRVADISKRHGGIFVSGIGQYEDASDRLQFSAEPHGLVSKIRPTFRDAASRLTTWRNITAGAGSLLHVRGKPNRIVAADIESSYTSWTTASRIYDSNFDLKIYDESTWEMATRIDYWTNAVRYAAWLLEWATTKPAANKQDADEYLNATVALRAAAIFEDAMSHQAEHNETIIDSVYKNLVR